MSLEQELLQGLVPTLASRHKCIILVLCKDNKIRAVMEDGPLEWSPPGAAPIAPAIRVFDDADDAVLFACDGPLNDETFQVVELEDMGIYDLGRHMSENIQFAITHRAPDEWVLRKWTPSGWLTRGQWNDVAVARTEAEIKDAMKRQSTSHRVTTKYYDEHGDEDVSSGW